ncbi:MAG: hypothetical protein JWQ75_2608 [Pseudarthrobacter sp.]|nr:hypothetical protein [Pseudarthrobacter sp.]
MRICGDCNARNNDGERFCSNCGAYLVWQQDAAKAEEPRPPRPPRRDTGTGKREAVTTAQLPIIPGPSAASPQGPSGRAHGDQRNAAVPNGPTSGVASAHNPQVASPDSFGATATVDPTRGDVLEERQPRQSDGRPPREPEPRRRHGETPPLPGGLTCRRCGADNKPEASFCRQCGAGLREAAVVPVPPWWRQLLGRSVPAALPAGTRPQWRKPRRVPAGAVSLLTVTGLFAGVAYAGRDVIARSVMRGVDEIREEAIPAQTKTSSTPAGGREADKAFDGTVRSWASDGSFEPGADYLEAGFERPFRLTYVVITCVAPSADRSTLTEQRPTKVEIVATRGDGQGSSLTVVIPDVSGSKSFYFGADGISTVRLNILETTGPAGASVSVADVQFAGWRW